MNALRALIAFLGIVLVAAAAAWFKLSLVMVIVPYAAFALFLIGFSYRILRWAWVPVPFRITTTCGQQKSLPWIRSAPLDNPSTGWGAFTRMSLEVLLFRSLFRNSRARLVSGKLAFREDQWLWLGALAFHWSLLTILLRHLRFFLQPIPTVVGGIERLDGIFQVGLPHIYISDVIFACALAYLIARRLRDPVLRFVVLRPFCTFSSVGDRGFRSIDAICGSSRLSCGQAIWAKSGSLTSARAHPGQPNLRNPPSIG